MQQENQSKKQMAALTLACLGIVYGDIGTSPLYAFRECFTKEHGLPLQQDTIFGVLSLIFWALFTIITIKYMVFILRADNRGEGGVIALGAICEKLPSKSSRLKKLVIGLALFGSALLYGDGIITPAISVLSAIEGLKVATPFFEPYVVPITMIILMGLFWAQKGGTEKIGKIFGPVMMVWFSYLGVLGIKGILMNPSVMTAINPMYAVNFFINYGKFAFFSLGAVFLVVTGGEALYADLGHFGKKPIRMTWLYLVLYCLLLNYFGQGAMLISHPESISNPFYELVPRILLYPSILLATFATVIASQAVISGVFSLTSQAIQLGYCPRFQVVHTSSKEKGQVYLPHINWMMLISTLMLVLMFRSSSALAAAYGVGVSLDMIITTLLFSYLAYKAWNWSGIAISAFVVFFLIIDVSFFAANAVKFMDGGWIPIVIAGTIFTLMTTWQSGRRLLWIFIKKQMVNIDKLPSLIEENKAFRSPGTAVFLTGNSSGLPPALVHNLRNNKVLHVKNIFLTIVPTNYAYVPYNEQIQIESDNENFDRVIVQIGFRQQPNVPKILKRVESRLKFNSEDLTYFIGRETLIPSSEVGMVFWRAWLFAIMSKNAQSATQYFNIPYDKVMEIGMQVKI